MDKRREYDFFRFDIIVADKILFLERRNRIFMAKISVIIPDEMKAEVEKIAAAQERNISWVIRKAVEQYLEETREKE